MHTEQTLSLPAAEAQQPLETGGATRRRERTDAGAEGASFEGLLEQARGRGKSTTNARRPDPEAHGPESDDGEGGAAAAPRENEAAQTVQAAPTGDAAPDPGRSGAGFPATPGEPSPAMSSGREAPLAGASPGPDPVLTGLARVTAEQAASVPGRGGPGEVHGPVRTVPQAGPAGGDGLGAALTGRDGEPAPGPDAGAPGPVSRPPGGRVSADGLVKAATGTTAAGTVPVAGPDSGDGQAPEPATSAPRRAAVTGSPGAPDGTLLQGPTVRRDGGVVSERPGTPTAGDHQGRPSTATQVAVGQGRSGPMGQAATPRAGGEAAVPADRIAAGGTTAAPPGMAPENPEAAGGTAGPADVSRTRGPELTAAPGSRESGAVEVRDPQSLAQVVIQRVRSARVGPDSGPTAVRLQLHPEALGELTVRLAWEEGRVSAQFQAATASARDVISEHLAELRQQLEAGGVRLGALDVDVGDPRDGADQAGGPLPGPHRGSNRRGPTEETAARTASQAFGRVHRPDSTVEFLA